MFGTIAHRLTQWRAQREGLARHEDTLRMFRKGEYPTHATIGLGQAFLTHLVDARTVCGSPWIRAAMHEGPAFLEAWRKASLQLKLSKTKGYYTYSPQKALDSIMSGFQKPWTVGWGPLFEGDERSPSMRVVDWVHRRDPQWIGNNLDVQLFTSSMSVWESLLYRDVDTSAWVVAQWPKRYNQQTFPWRDWATNECMWLYPLVFKCQERSPSEHGRLVAHLSAWSPLNGLAPAQRLQEAMAMLELPPNIQKNQASIPTADRGLIWKALTHGMPIDVVDPIGAALACAWPDMHPDCTAIARHFYPELQPVSWEHEALPTDGPACPKNDALRGSFATASLYNDPLVWAHAFAQTLVPDGAQEHATDVSLPANLLD